MMITSTLLSLALSLLSTLTRTAASSEQGFIRHAPSRHLAAVSFGLIDTSSNQKILDLSNDAVINIGDLQSTLLSVEAVLPSGMSVSNVVFGFNGNLAYSIASVAPYALCGAENGVFKPCPGLIVGNHTITVTPSGGTSTTVGFSIVNQPVAAPAPAPAPAIAPIPAPISDPIPAPAPIPGSVSAPGPAQACGVPKVRSQNLNTRVPDTAHCAGLHSSNLTPCRCSLCFSSFGKLVGRVPIKNILIV